MTTEPCNYFSNYILQLAIKMVVEPANSLKRIVYKLYKTLNDEDGDLSNNTKH